MIGGTAQTAQLTGKPVTPPIDLDAALKDAIRGTGAPADWNLDDDQIDAEKQAMAQSAQAGQIAQEINTGAQVAGTAADSLQRLREVGIA